MVMYCCVKSCYFSKLSKHRFPNPRKDPKRFEIWLKLCGNEELLNKPAEVVYANNRVCSKHFTASDFGPNNVLLKTAVPSVHLPGMVPQVIDPPDANSGAPRQVQTVCKDSSNIVPEYEFGEPIAGPSNLQNNNSSSDDYNLQRTPKKGLLKDVQATMTKQLSPKAKHFYERAKRYRKQSVKISKTRKSLKRKLKHAAKEYFSKKTSSMDRIKKRFFESQIENASRKPAGRRYSLEDKVLALALYKHSASNYRFMSTIFNLPSRRTISKLLNNVPVKPGFNNEVFEILKLEVTNMKHEQEKYCVLMFDEMSIQPGLGINNKDGSVVGFEDYGYRTTDKISNHAQVYMLRGIQKKWKQPIYFNFCHGATKASDIVHILKLIVKKCNEIGLKIVGTVCDQGSNNVSAINTLVNDTRAEYLRKGSETSDEYVFEIDGAIIIPLYDIPHIFKGLRNNFILYDIYYIKDGGQKVAKWTHLKTLYEMDSCLGELQMCPKLTEKHISENKINKMKVSTCCQVFSHSVAVAINVLAKSGMAVEFENQKVQLPPESEDTALLIEFFDKLFDSLNGSTFQPLGGKTFRVAVRKNSPHHALWNEALLQLQSMKFKKGDSFFVPPSVRNLVKTIKNVKLLFENLTRAGFDHMMPRTFNQDPLENFFGQVRQRAYRSTNPTAEAFIPIYKSLLIKNLTSKHSPSANCEQDDSEIFISLQRLVTQQFAYEEPETTPYTSVPENLPIKLVAIQRKVLKYVCGFLIKKNKKNKVGDCYCKKIFLLKDNARDNEDDEFVLEKEYDSTKNHLYYVSREFLFKISKAYAIIKFILRADLHKKGILFHLLKTLKDKVILTNCEHNSTISSTIFKYFIKIYTYHIVRQLNNVIKGKNTKNIPPNSSKYFKNAKQLQTKYFNYKKLNIGSKKV